MKVHFILQNPYPYGAAMTFRAFCYAKGIIKNGVECEIVVPQPYDYPDKIVNIENKGIYKETSFHYSTTNTVRSRSFIKRRIDDLWGYIKTYIYLLRKTKKQDIVIISRNSHFFTMFLFIICKIRSLHLVKELNEYPYITSREKPEKILKKQKRFFEKVLPRFDGIMTISDTLMDVVEKYSEKPKIKVPIIVDKDIPDAIIDDVPPIDSKYIFHSGTLYEEKDGICGIIKAFGMAKPHIDTDTKLIFTGNLDKSPNKKEIEEIISEYHLEDSVIFKGYMPFSKLRQYQKYCTLVIINKYPTKQNKYCFATKTGEYLLFSRPIIMTNVGEAMNYLKDGENAYIVEPHRPEMIAEKIVDIFNNPEKAKEIGNRGHLLTEKEFDNIYQGKRLVSFFKQLQN